MFFMRNNKNYDNELIPEVNSNEVAQNTTSSLEQVNENTTVQEVVENPAFNGFGKYIFPLNRYSSYSNMKISNINSLLPYHSHINTNSTIEVINYMINEVNNGEQIFYNIYFDEEKAQDSSKQDTGLFFFRGNENAPFAIICAGGGFSYVGSIHEAYPHALELNKQGYNAFVIQYRTDSQEATEDLARAISYIFQNAEQLKISTSNYSLWGSSAGARMVAYIGTYGVEELGGANVPKPATIIMAYTGHTDYSESDPPTFIVVGEAMKSIFVIGDSISLYYHKYLKELFKNVAEYSRKGSEEDIKIALEDPNNPFGANGGDSRRVKAYMEKMKKENIHVDILLVNCGLHDIRKDRVTGKIQVPEEEYAKNLEDIIKLGKEIAKEFIWISSTHVDDNLHQQRKEGCYRYNKDVIRYNEIANDIMKKNGIRIIDLYKFTYNLKNDNMYRDHVHYTDEISKKQAEFIYNELNIE